MRNRGACADRTRISGRPQPLAVRANSGSCGSTITPRLSTNSTCRPYLPSQNASVGLRPVESASLAYKQRLEQLFLSGGDHDRGNREWNRCDGAAFNYLAPNQSAEEVLVAQIFTSSNSLRTWHRQIDATESKDALRISAPDDWRQTTRLTSRDERSPSQASHHRQSAYSHYHLERSQRGCHRTSASAFSTINFKVARSRPS